MADEHYNDRLSPDKQVTMEERIAALLFDDEDFEVSERAAQEMSRGVLRLVLAEFRPDLFEGAKPTALEGAARWALSIFESVSFEDGPYSDYETDREGVIDDLRAALGLAPPDQDGEGQDERPTLPEGWPGLLTGNYRPVDLRTGEAIAPACQMDGDHAQASNAHNRAMQSPYRWFPEVRDVPPGFRLIYHVLGDATDDWYGELVVAYRAFEELLKEHTNARLYYEIEALPLTGEADEEGAIETVGNFPV